MKQFNDYYIINNLMITMCVKNSLNKNFFKMKCCHNCRSVRKPKQKYKNYFKERLSMKKIKFTKNKPINNKDRLYREHIIVNKPISQFS